MHSWLLVGDICTSNDRVCKVPLQTNLKPTHHLLARWQGQVRRCLKTIHAINLFPPKWLPIICFTLIKDGVQILNVSQREIWIKLLGLASLIISEGFPLMWKFNVAELNFWKATCSISMSPATGWLLLCEEVLNLHSFSPALQETAKVLVFLLSLVLHVFGVLISLWLHHKKCQSHKCCWPCKGVKDCTNNGFLCKVLLQTCATFIPGFLLETFAPRMTGSARYLCKQTWNLHTISWHAGRVKSEGASKQFMPSTCSLRNGFPSIALPWLRMACKL